MTLIRLAVELSLTVFTTENCRGWYLNTQPAACGANALTQCATAATIRKKLLNIYIVKLKKPKNLVVVIFAVEVRCGRGELVGEFTLSETKGVDNL